MPVTDTVVTTLVVIQGMEVVMAEAMAVAVAMAAGAGTSAFACPWRVLARRDPPHCTRRGVGR